MNAAQKYELTDLSKFVGDHYQGFDFLEEVLVGLPVIARPELSKLRLPDDASSEAVRAEVSKWNKLFKSQFPGAGYYAHSQEPEDLLNNNVFVIFADDAFYEAYLKDTSSEEVIVELPHE